MRSIILLILTLASTSAHAYVGPGLGLGVLGALFGLILTVLLAIFGVFWYPIKRLVKKKRNAKQKSQEAVPDKQDRDNNKGTDSVD